MNECQHTGAKLQDDLAIILMRFRTYRTGLTADYKAMYCQVSMHEKHKKYQKILWRSNPSDPVSVYQLNRVAFGQTAAPFLAIRAMQQCADDYEGEYPMGAKEVRKSFYVDDMLTGADSPGEAIEKSMQITKILEKGKFTLAKWCSNKQTVNEYTRGELAEVEIKDPDMSTVLGLRWLALKDTIKFKIQLSETGGI